MKVTIYWDILFIINFLVICVSTWIAAKVNRETVSYTRMILGAVWNSLLFILSIYYPIIWHKWIGCLYWIGVTAGTIVITFGLKKMLLHWFWSTTAMFLIGSLMLFIKEKCHIHIVTFQRWLLIFGVGSLLCIVFFRNYIRKQKGNLSVCDMILELNGKQIRLIGFCDNGNLLTDPYTGYSVVIVQSEIIKNAITLKGKMFIDYYEREGRMNEQLLLDPEIALMGFHLFSYQSIGMASGKLLGFYVENISIPQFSLSLNKQPVALAGDALLKERRYQAIINEKALER